MSKKMINGGFKIVFRTQKITNSIKKYKNNNAIRMEAKGENNVIYEFYVQNYN